MTISGALYNALSSMAAEQAQAQIIANNIANANTPGYVRRVLPMQELITGRSGQGVAVGVAQRAGDAILEAGMRSAGSDQGYGTAMASGLASLAQLVGSPSDNRSLAARMGDFQAAMTALSATPSDSVAQSQALAAAEDLATSFNGLARAVGDGRATADRQIDLDVASVNRSLQDLQGVETRLARAIARGESTAAYEDQRAGILADLSASLPVRVLNSKPGQLILATDQGTTLFDSGTVHALQFTASAGFGTANAIGGAVTVDGAPMRSSATGSIAASLQLRDSSLPEYGRMLDSMAAALAGGFQDADPTATGTPKLAGLFTRGTAATLDPTQTDGMAAVLQVNPAVIADPTRLRDGANAAAGGAPGNNSLILAGLDALDTTRSFTLPGMTAKLALNDAAAQVMGMIQSDAADWATRASARTNAAAQAGQALSNGTGVNTDEELQKLLVVQNAYAASAQVVQVVSRMLDVLNNLNG